jgi:hypothetical protein
MGRLLAIVVLVAAWPTLASAEVVQKGGVRIAVSAQLSPGELPRRGTAPVAISLTGRIRPTTTEALPQLEAITIGINSHGRLRSRGLPLCRMDEIDPSTTAGALAACRPSLIGKGHFSADVRLPEQSPFPSKGRLVAFNARYRGLPAILAHIYGTDPVPTSYVLPFLIRTSKGSYGTVLEAVLPKVTGDWGFVTGIAMTLERSYKLNGKRVSYLSAGCPAPAGFSRAVFPLASTRFTFANGLALSSVIVRSCRVGRR